MLSKGRAAPSETPLRGPLALSVSKAADDSVNISSFLREDEAVNEACGDSVLCSAKRRGELDDGSVSDPTGEESQQICGGSFITMCVDVDEQTPGLPDSGSNSFF